MNEQFQMLEIIKIMGDYDRLFDGDKHEWLDRRLVSIEDLMLSL